MHPTSSQLIKESGLTVTPQRVAILDILRTETGHPTPDWIYKLASETFPHLSLATVYNTLERFEEVGLARKVNALYGTARYDSRTDFHLHAVCISCGRIQDVEPEQVNIEWPPQDLLPDFSVETLSVHLLGLCRPCKEREMLKNGGQDVETLSPGRS